MAAPKSSQSNGIDRRIAVAGWALAAGFLVFAGSLHGKNAALLKRIDDMERADGERLLLYEQQARQIVRLESFAARLRGASNALDPRDGDEAPGASRDARLPTEPAASPRTLASSTLEDILRAGASEETLRRSAALSVEMQYGDLFEVLDLPAERAEALRAASTMAVASEMESDLAAVSGKGGAPKDQGSANAIRAAVEALLTESERAAFRDYQDALPERMAREAFSAELALWAKELTAENRAEALDILVEEMLRASDGAGLDLQGQLDARREALTAAKARLEQEWSAEEFAIFDRFIAALLSGSEAVDSPSE
ncbi:MAG TPA: hypothetical protein QF901_12405 [Gammaproteobacteria bacterium]|nr:hypothetical protein [Gammaproteobacteria bacterium]